jgi:hypothetical protein
MLIAKNKESVDFGSVKLHACHSSTSCVSPAHILFLIYATKRHVFFKFLYVLFIIMDI